MTLDQADLWKRRAQAGHDCSCSVVTGVVYYNQLVRNTEHIENGHDSAEDRLDVCGFLQGRQD